MSEVEHPSHYNNHPSGVEVIEYARLLPFGPGSAVKYVMRREHKGQPEQDIAKALFLLDDSLAHGVRYPLTPRMRDLVVPVIEAEPNSTVALFLMALYVPPPRPRSYVFGPEGDVALARDLLATMVTP